MTSRNIVVEVVHGGFLFVKTSLHLQHLHGVSAAGSEQCLLCMAPFLSEMHFAVLSFVLTHGVTVGP